MKNDTLKGQYRINEQIRAKEVRIVSDDIEPKVYPIFQALKMAEEKELDLVEISPNAQPPVCRIIDYSKFLYQLKKRQKEQKAKQVKVNVKEIRFGPQTDDHDYNFKLKHAKGFLEDGDKVKAYVFFKGRSILFKEQGEVLLLRFANDLEDYAKVDQMPILEGKRKLLQDHPEYVRQVDEIAFAPVYQDELGQLHGVAVEDGYEEKIRENITYAEEKLQEYIKGNGQICSLQIDYCLEYRIPEMILIHEEELSENLVSYCKKHGHEIRHVSFYTYYKDDMDSYTRYKMFPYIQFEEGVEWNVPYDRVTIRDFLRTFPEAEEKGILVQANNMGGDGIQIAQAVLQGWKTFLYHSSQILDTLGINSLADAIDWASRVVFIYQSIGWLKESFGKRIEKKPTIEQLEEYIRRAERWELSQLSSTLHAAPELLKLVLSEVGYISQDGELFVYDEVIATQRKEEERKRKAEKENSHGTQVDCRKMNKVIEELNVTILYYASLQNEKKAEECGKETRIGKCVEQVICKYREFLWWDEVREELKVRDPLPEKFTEEIQGKICRDVRALEEELSGKCREVE